MAVVCAAVLATLSASGGVWLLVLLLPAGVILRALGTRLALRGGAVGGARSASPFRAADRSRWLRATDIVVFDERHREGQPGGAAQPAADIRCVARGRLPIQTGRHFRHTCAHRSGRVGGDGSGCYLPGGAVGIGLLLFVAGTIAAALAIVAANATTPMSTCVAETWSVESEVALGRAPEYLQRLARLPFAVSLVSKTTISVARSHLLDGGSQAQQALRRGARAVSRRRARITPASNAPTAHTT